MRQQAGNTPCECVFAHGGVKIVVRLRCEGARWVRLVLIASREEVVGGGRSRAKAQVAVRAVRRFRGLVEWMTCACNNLRRRRDENSSLPRGTEGRTDAQFQSR